MAQTISRRGLLASALAGSAAYALPSCTTTYPRRVRRADDKLNLGIIGVGGRGSENMSDVSSENIVALCDVDEKELRKAAGKHPRAKTFFDYRDLLTLRDLDAVVISTADHTHALIAAAALRRDLDVYCEKPLTHTVGEARYLTNLARQKGAVTQMGIQIHDHANFRRVVELVQSRAIGNIKEVHVFVNGSNWSQGKLSAAPNPIPGHFHYDLWLGGARAIPYDPGYHPAGWRRWWEFGNGTMGDMACHYLDLAFWALELDHAVSVKASGPPLDLLTTPDRLKVEFQFPARGDRPEVPLTWYDGRMIPEILSSLGLSKWTNGVLFIGDRGWIIANYDIHTIGPAAEATKIKIPDPWLPDSVGHHREWIEACKSRGSTSCGFEYAGPLTEAVLLGIVSYRSGVGFKWDAAQLVADHPKANELVHKHYRAGWSLT